MQPRAHCGPGKGEGRIETAGTLSLALAILPERSAYNTYEPRNQGRDLRVKVKYRSETNVL